MSLEAQFGQEKAFDFLLRLKIHSRGKFKKSRINPQSHILSKHKVLKVLQKAPELLLGGFCGEIVFVNYFCLSVAFVVVCWVYVCLCTCVCVCVSVRPGV